jgi:hypothetical protein
MSEDTSPNSHPGAEAPPGPGLWQRRGADIGLAILAVYVVLLAIGTLAELLDIQWILDLPIY